jgi:hypothetical protein
MEDRCRLSDRSARYVCAERSHIPMRPGAHVPGRLGAPQCASSLAIAHSVRRAAVGDADDLCCGVPSYLRGKNVPVYSGAHVASRLDATGCPKPLAGGLVRKERRVADPISREKRRAEGRAMNLQHVVSSANEKESVRPNERIVVHVRFGCVLVGMAAIAAALIASCSGKETATCSAGATCGVVDASGGGGGTGNAGTSGQGTGGTFAGSANDAASSDVEQTDGAGGAQGSGTGGSGGRTDDGGNFDSGGWRDVSSTDGDANKADAPPDPFGEIPKCHQASDYDPSNADCNRCHSMGATVTCSVDPNKFDMYCGKPFSDCTLKNCERCDPGTCMSATHCDCLRQCESVAIDPGGCRGVYLTQYNCLISMCSGVCGP